MLITLTFAMLVLGDKQRDMEAMTGFDWFVGSVGVVLIGLFVVQTTRSVRKLALIEPPK